MNIIEEAVAFAWKAHEGTVRTGSTLPYILHPLEAGAIVARITDDPEVIAAAILHDVVEDTAFTEKDICRRFGSRVALLVMADTENKRPWLLAAETWMLRKQETIERLQKATDEEKMIAFGDKLANLRSMLSDYKRQGEPFWNRFVQKDPQKHLWYYSALMDIFVTLFEKLPDTTLFSEYCRCFANLRMLVQEYQTFGRHDPRAFCVLSQPGDDTWVLQRKDTADVLVMSQEEFQAFIGAAGGKPEG